VWVVSKFRKKPVVIDAIQWTGNNTEEIERFMGQKLKKQMSFDNSRFVLIIPTLEGQHIASVNDWIIKGVKGEFYPCKPDVFEQTYEAF
jgi:hypothetical protein